MTKEEKDEFLKEIIEAIDNEASGMDSSWGQSKQERAAQLALEKLSMALGTLRSDRSEDW